MISYFREFDPGSGRTLAACLTHASRTDLRLTRKAFEAGRKRPAALSAARKQKADGKQKGALHAKKSVSNTTRKKSLACWP